MANAGRSDDVAWRILVVDDVPSEAWASVAALETVTEQRYAIESRTSPSDALTFAREWRPDLIILDINMPEMDGYELAQSLRDGGCDASRLFLTSRNGIEDEIEGLELADDFIQKPFRARIFLARVRNILSRRGQPNAVTAPRDWRLHVDAENLRVTLPDGDVKELTRNEMRMLQALVRAEGEVVTYEDLVRAVWVDEARSAGDALDVKGYSGGLSQMVRRLRGKIESEPGRPRRILNVERVGYRYNPRADEPAGEPDELDGIGESD